MDPSPHYSNTIAQTLDTPTDFAVSLLYEDNDI